jgi:hypothetical protein
MADLTEEQKWSYWCCNFPGSSVNSIQLSQLSIRLLYGQREDRMRSSSLRSRCTHLMNKLDVEYQNTLEVLKP